MSGQMSNHLSTLGKSIVQCVSSVLVTKNLQLYPTYQIIIKTCFLNIQLKIYATNW